MLLQTKQWLAYIYSMPSKPIELPPAVARRFLEDCARSLPKRAPSSATRSQVGRSLISPENETPLVQGGSSGVREGFAS